VKENIIITLVSGNVMAKTSAADLCERSIIFSFLLLNVVIDSTVAPTSWSAVAWTSRSTLV
jgi:hypothetical protein